VIQANTPVFRRWRYPLDQRMRLWLAKLALLAMASRAQAGALAARPVPRRTVSGVALPAHTTDRPLALLGVLGPRAPRRPSGSVCRCRPAGGCHKPCLLANPLVSRPLGGASPATPAENWSPLIWRCSILLRQALIAAACWSGAAFGMGRPADSRCLRPARESPQVFACCLDGPGTTRELAPAAWARWSATSNFVRCPLITLLFSARTPWFHAARRPGTGCGSGGRPGCSPFFCGPPTG